jgi:hypothetical protein
MSKRSIPEQMIEAVRFRRAADLLRVRTCGNSDSAELAKVLCPNCHDVQAAEAIRTLLEEREGLYQKLSALRASAASDDDDEGASIDDEILDVHETYRRMFHPTEAERAEDEAAVSRARSKA